MKARKPDPQPPLIFAWHARDHSVWHLSGALLVLAGAMAGFFFVFRIVHPVAQRLPATPQHIISLNPDDPASLALIHRAQDRSFALLDESKDLRAQDLGLLAFRPSFEGRQPRLREPAPEITTARRPQLFTPGVNVLPPLPPRVIGEAPAPRAASLRAIVGGALANRGSSNVRLPGIALTQPTRVQFRVAVGAAGQVITALPMGSTEDSVVMAQLHAAVSGLRFAPSEVSRIEWGVVSFRWEEEPPP